MVQMAGMAKKAMQNPMRGLGRGTMLPKAISVKK
jgi:hypothetical protein